ncbi:MAG: hypothetical protein ACE5HV_14240, partial [Acidobacteriota bacterium]
ATQSSCAIALAQPRAVEKCELGASKVISMAIGLLMLSATLSPAQERSSYFRALDTRQPIGYFIAPGGAESGYRPGDEVLARWALEAWQKAAAGAIQMRPVAREKALIRLFWAPPQGGLYGEMRRIKVGGQRGAVVFVLPDTRGLGPDIDALARKDPLFRDTVVYLTCLHELGHGLGLQHTAEFDDIMYFFGHGGDIPQYFLRYRNKLAKRDDISSHSGLSDHDVQRLRDLYDASVTPQENMPEEPQKAGAVTIASGMFSLPAAGGFQDAGFHKSFRVAHLIPEAVGRTAGRRLVVALRDASRPSQTCSAEHPTSGCATVDWSDLQGRPHVPRGGVFDNSLQVDLTGGSQTFYLSEKRKLGEVPDPYSPT